MKHKNLMRSLYLATLVAASVNAQNNSPMKYPTTQTVLQEDNYFGNIVKDPYRWLEDDRSEATGKWVKTQNEVTNQFLNQIPYREALKQRLEKLWNYEKIGSPFKEGKYTYFYKNYCNKII